jgi:acyl dehydratase
MPAAVYALSDLPAHVGRTLGTSGWFTVDQDRIDDFARVTGDHAWIHVDRERAATGPFGGTIAHGYLTLSLLPMLLSEAVQVTGVGLRINYGLNRLRFPAPVPAGSRVRVVAWLASFGEAGGMLEQVTRATVELEGSEKPACVADVVVRMIAEGASA